MKKEKSLQEKMLDEMAFNMLEDGKIIQHIESGNLYKVDKENNGIYPSGGGFIISLENISLMDFKEYDVAANVGKFNKAYYNFDENDIVIQGFYDINYKYWNGWGYPHFTKEAINKVQMEVFSSDYYQIYYNEKIDTYLIKSEDFEAETKGFDIEYDGKIYHVYDFSLGFTWNHYDDLDEAKEYGINEVFNN